MTAPHHDTLPSMFGASYQRGAVLVSELRRPNPAQHLHLHRKPVKLWCSGQLCCGRRCLVTHVDVQNVPVVSAADAYPDEALHLAILCLQSFFGFLDGRHRNLPDSWNVLPTTQPTGWRESPDGFHDSDMRPYLHRDRSEVLAAANLGRQYTH
jgi:hypothetical protein